MSNETFLITGVTLVAVTALLVILRIGANSRYTKRLLASDYMSTVAVIFLGGNLAVMYLTVKAFTTLTTSLMTVQKLGNAIGLVAGASMWSSKAPILLLYTRLFSVERWLRITSYLILITTIIVYLVGALVPFCRTKHLDPMNPSDLMYLANCAEKSAIAGVSLGSISVVTDVIIFFLPIPSILRLQLDFHKKVGLMVVFCSGILAIAASAVSLHYKAMSFRGESSEMTIAMICTVIECAIAIMVSCAPGIYCFGANFAKSEIYQKVKSAVSQISIPSFIILSKVSRNGSSSSSIETENQYNTIKEGRHVSKDSVVEELQPSFALGDIEANRG